MKYITLGFSESIIIKPCILTLQKGGVLKPPLNKIGNLKTFYKNFPRLFLSPNPSYANKWVKIVRKQVFTGGALKASPPTQCQFQRPLLEGLIVTGEQVDTGGSSTSYDE